VDRFVLRVFQFEVELQCKFVLRAARDLEEALDAGDIDAI
jgi:hypothetical protein